MSVERRNLAVFNPAQIDWSASAPNYSEAIANVGAVVAGRITKDKTDAYAADKANRDAILNHMDGVAANDAIYQADKIQAGVNELAAARKQYGNGRKYQEVANRINIDLAKYQYSSKAWDKVNADFAAMVKNPPNNLKIEEAKRLFVAQGKLDPTSRNLDVINQMLVDPKLVNIDGAISDAAKKWAVPAVHNYTVEKTFGDIKGTQEMAIKYDAGTSTHDPKTHVVTTSVSDDQAIAAWESNPQAFKNYLIGKEPELKAMYDRGETGDANKLAFDLWKKELNSRMPKPQITEGQFTQKHEIANPYNSATFVKSAADQAKEATEIAGLQSILSEKSAAGVIGAKFGGIATQTPNGGWSIKVKGIRQPYVFGPEQFGLLAGELFTRSHKATVGASNAPTPKPKSAYDF